MITANFSAYSKYVTDSLNQWDQNQTLQVSGLNLASAPEVHFSNANCDRAIVRQSTMENHIVSVSIPNSLLQDPLRIYAHIGIYEGSTFKVVELVEIPVIARKRPLDYQIEDTDEEIYSFKRLENLLSNAATKDQVANIVAGVTSDSELIDVRYGADGVTYASAGEAVRVLSADIASDFVKSGGADRYITNVEIYTDEYDHLLISDIRNGYNDSVGFVLFSCDENGENFTSIRAVHELSVTQKRVQVLFGTNSILIADFDVSGLESGNRYTDTGIKSKVKPARIFSRKLLNETESVAGKLESLTPNASIALFEKMGVIGDSFASGEIYVAQSDGTYQNADYYSLSWGQIIARSNGMTCKNYSAGGLTTKTWLTSEKGLTLLQADEAQQLYVFALGINDVYKLGTEYLGTINDITSDYENNPDSFYGNYGRIIEQVKIHAPNGKIILSTMAENSGDCAMFNAAIVAIAGHYGVPCIKQYEDEFFTSAFYTEHQVQGHPISVVYSGMAKAITRLIESTMVVHYGYFNDYIG